MKKIDETTELRGVNDDKHVEAQLIDESIHTLYRSAEQAHQGTQEDGLRNWLIRTALFMDQGIGDRSANDVERLSHAIATERNNHSPASQLPSSERSTRYGPTAVTPQPQTATTIVLRYERASPETRQLIERLLEQDRDDQAWAEQIGPAYSQTHVAKLLRIPEDAAATDPRLLRLTMRSGKTGYPAFQFDGRKVLPGIAGVIEILSPIVATEWTIASWLTSPQQITESQPEHRPVDLLRTGSIEIVLATARRVAHAMAG